MQLPADGILLVQHQPLPLAASLDIEFLRHHVGLFNLLRVVNINTGLPGERLGHDMLTIPIIITEPGVVRTAERQITFQSSLLLFFVTIIDALCQVVESYLTGQRIVVRERAFFYECPVLLLVQSRIECYHSFYSHTVSSFLVFR